MFKKKNIWWVYVAFFGLLLGAFYLALYREPNFHDSKLAVINPNVPDFHFVNQDGKLITQKNTQDKVYVAEYFFTTCRGICPLMNANMRRIYDQFKDEKEFMIISHTCMPETDSVPLLKAYEQKMINGELIKNDDGSYKIYYTAAENTNAAKNYNWNFVTGDKAQLYNLARQGYMIDNGKPDSTQLIKDQFIHSQFFALVDKYGRVRGIYDGLKEDEVQKLIQDIGSLLKEKVDHSRFMNNFSNTPSN
ncbi:MAG: SCO family protein [Bacteroidetes bacterium]|jgi:protein SCO1/2|nr:SCO family protein [Bacteroidota bacterium]